MAEAGEWQVPEIPIHGYLDLDIDVQDGGRAVVELPLTDPARGLVAPVHGGVLATLADVACASALAQSFEMGVEIPVSVDLHVRYYRQPKESPVVAEAEIVHRGSKIIGVECVIRDAGGRQLARATGSYMIVPGFGELGEPPAEPA